MDQRHDGMEGLVSSVMAKDMLVPTLPLLYLSHGKGESSMEEKGVDITPMTKVSYSPRLLTIHKSLVSLSHTLSLNVY